MKKTLPKKKIRTAVKNYPLLKRTIIKTEIARQLKQQRKPFHKITTTQKIAAKNIKTSKDTKTIPRAKEFVKTGIPGFDALLDQGIPKGTSVLIAGGTGTGKTIFCLQTLFNVAQNGEKCLYLSFEESEERLKKHMDDCCLFLE